MKRMVHSTRLNNWQEAGISLGGNLVDSRKLIKQVLPRIADQQHRREIEHYCGGTEKEPFPSRAALQALKAAILLWLTRKPE
jgi:hypothetical protein